MQDLARASDEIASGNYAVQVPVGRGGSEVSHLSERFNEMAARLAATEERERQFLMSVSHELRTPLTAIKGHVDALRDGLIDDPELVAASLDVVANEATRLERLVGDVLDLAKLRAHRFTVHTEEVDMGRLVEQAYGSFGDEARRREIAYTIGGADDAPTIITDGDRVLQVITNLLKNAFRWTPDGGAIGLALDASNGTVRVEVTDTGPGIPRDEHSGSSARSCRTTRRARASDCPSRGSLQALSAAASSSRASPAAAVASVWCCPPRRRRCLTPGAAAKPTAAQARPQ